MRVPPSPSEPGRTGTGSGSRPAAPRSPARSSTAVTAAPSGRPGARGRGEPSRWTASRSRRAGTISGATVAVPGESSPSRRATVRLSSARRCGARGARLITGRRRRGSTPWAARAARFRTSRCTPPTSPVPVTTTTSAAAVSSPGTGVAVLHVERAGLGLALEVRVGVGDDGGVGPAQRGDRRIEGPGPQHGPVAVAAQPGQEVVPTVGERPQRAPDLGGVGSARAVQLDQLLEARARRRRCRGAGRGWRRGRRRRGRPVPRWQGRPRPPGPRAMATVEVPLPPAPTTVISRPSPPALADAVGRRRSGRARRRGARSTGLACSRSTARIVSRSTGSASTATAPRSVQRRRPGAAGDHDRRASGPAGLVEQIAVEAAASLVDDRGRPRATDRQAGPAPRRPRRSARTPPAAPRTWPSGRRRRTRRPGAGRHRARRSARSS